MRLLLPLAQEAGYTLAGALTVVAALVVTVVMVMTSRSDGEGPEGP